MENTGFWLIVFVGMLLLTAVAMLGHTKELEPPKRDSPIPPHSEEINQLRDDFKDENN